VITIVHDKDSVLLYVELCVKQTPLYKDKYFWLIEMTNLGT